MPDARNLWRRLTGQKTGLRIVAASAPPPEPLLPVTHQAAAQALAAPDLVKSKRFLEREWEIDRSLLNPQMRDFADALMRDLKRRGIPLFIHCGLRSDSEQNRLYAAGRSKARAGQSAHNYGCAIDVIHLTKGWELTQKEWAIIGLIGKEVARKRCLKITWGGDWNFYDPAHWEFTNWRALAADE